VRKGFLRLLHRDNRGTAYRVFLPREAAGKLDDDVLLGVVRAEAPPQPVAPDASVRGAAIPLGDARTRALAVALAAARGAPEGEGIPAALREIAELVADGATPRQVEAAIRAVTRRRASRGETP
jgi:hypothetical protein